MTRFKLIKWLHSTVIKKNESSCVWVAYWTNTHLNGSPFDNPALTLVAICVPLFFFALILLARIRAFESILFFTRFTDALGYCQPAKYHTIHFTTCSQPSWLFFSASAYCRLCRPQDCCRRSSFQAHTIIIYMVRQCGTWRARACTLYCVCFF